MKKDNKELYFAPLCENIVSLQDTLCADSVGTTTEDYTDGGDFTW